MQELSTSRIAGTWDDGGYWAATADGNYFPLLGFAVLDNGDAVGYAATGDVVVPVYELEGDFVQYVHGSELP
jgi:hypothetical protein